MIYLASDHRGYELKEKIKTWLKGWDYDFQDMGPDKLDPGDDYPDFVSRAAEKVSGDPEGSKGIVLGYSGQGEAIVANKFKGVRAVVYYGTGEALDPDKPGTIEELSRKDDDSNVLSIAAGFVDEETIRSIIKTWLETPFSKIERHQRRIDKIKTIEENI